MFHCCPGCVEPNNDEVVWRYMDLAKYVSLIARRKLFFPRVGLMEDRFEGTYTRRHVPDQDEIARMIEYARDNLQELVKDFDDKKIEAVIEASREASLETVGHLRKYAFVSCWHMNPHESAAMWKLYLKSDEGIAIRTTYGRLKESLSGGMDGAYLMAGKVQYLDYNSETVNHTNFFHPFMCKRRSFEHENEVRLACLDLVSTVKIANKESVVDLPGVDFDVETEVLIGDVFVAPTSPKWFRDVVAEINGKFGITLQTKQSDLDSDPLL